MLEFCIQPLLKRARIPDRPTWLSATEALACAFLALVEPGDEVVMFQPVYDAYAPIVRRAGGVPVMGKLCTARRVCTPKRASSGTSRAPSRSVSVRVRPLA